MARPDKAAAVAELAEEFRSSNKSAILTEYRGLSVAQLKELRRALGSNATYTVVKNTLTKIAAREAGVDAFDDMLTGPSAIAFITGDAVEAAKGLRDFARVHSPLVIKGGVLDGAPLTVDEIAKIADLESREVLLAKLAGALLASLQNAAALFDAPLSQAARVVAALRDKIEQEAPAQSVGTDEAETNAAETDASDADRAVAENAEPDKTEAEASASA